LVVLTFSWFGCYLITLILKVCLLFLGKDVNRIWGVNDNYQWDFDLSCNVYIMFYNKYFYKNMEEFTS
jgi:hypothetical protein